MTFINKTDIKKFGTFTDRKNSFDDDLDIETFIKFLKIAYDDQNAEFVSKPFGIYNVDIGVYVDGKLKLTVDVERWKSWDSEWPSYYSHVSFLGRKEKFLTRKENFCMVYFNNTRDKFICVDKKDILKYPTVNRNVKGKLDRVKIVSFDDARLYGADLTEREKTLFKKHCVCEFK